MKTIGVLTSGGDAPGMNAAVRAVVRTGLENDMRVLGIYNGYEGLMSGDVTEMNLRSVSNIVQRGGTVLRTARSMEFMTDRGQEKAADMCRRLGIEGVVVIGGDGSFRGAQALSHKGINCVGIPGTINNDISCTDLTIGFDTAVNTV
ncbi:MAG: 6-phosphofructokinase, partial [Clostridia bacterium]|nr:6-phosphofructokinase [Clostridia bacterium]